MMIIHAIAKPVIKAAAKSVGEKVATTFITVAAAQVATKAVEAVFARVEAKLGQPKNPSEE